MPDRALIDEPQKSKCVGLSAPAGVRLRAPIARTELLPDRDEKRFAAVGRKNSRIRRLDSRGSVNK